VEEDELGERVGALGRLDVNGHSVLLSRARPLPVFAGIVEGRRLVVVEPRTA